MVEFKRPTKEMIQYIADNMRHADVVEVKASNNFTPLAAIEVGLKASTVSSVAIINGDIVAVLGVVKLGMLSDDGVPWLLGTTNIKKHYREFLESSKAVLDDMLNVTPCLTNYVHVENKVSIRWLRWLGFQFSRAEPFGVNGELFHKFTMSKNYV